MSVYKRLREFERQIIDGPKSQKMSQSLME